VHDSELYALLRVWATQYLFLSLFSKRIRVFTESMSVAQALSRSFTSFSIVEECHNALNGFRLMRVILMPSSSGYAVNEKADMQATEATEVKFCGPEPVLPVSLNKIHSKVVTNSGKKVRSAVALFRQVLPKQDLSKEGVPLLL